MRVPFSSAVAIACLVLSACQCGPQAGDEEENDEGRSTDGGDGDAGLAGDGGLGQDGGEDPPFDGGSCATVSAEATTGLKPVDIILVIDNTDSMTNEIKSVQRNINQNFAQIIGASGLDYRVILFSAAGSADERAVCITQPLSGNDDCDPPTPINGARFFHYSQRIGNHNSIARLLTQFSKRDPYGLAPNGWKEWLRPNALRTVIEITDDNPETTAAQMDEALLSLAPYFGTATARNYTFHSIVGMKENNPSTRAWTPRDPEQVERCRPPTGPLPTNNGLEYQRLSILTGGLRFPICQYESFDEVFRAVATGVVENAAVACDFAIPEVPAGKSINASRVVYTPGAGGPAQTFEQVASEAECAPGKYAISAGRIVLCPATCAAVTSDLGAKIDVLFTCEVPIN